MNFDKADRGQADLTQRPLMDVFFTSPKYDKHNNPVCKYFSALSSITVCDDTLLQHCQNSNPGVQGLGSALERWLEFVVAYAGTRSQ